VEQRDVESLACESERIAAVRRVIVEVEGVGRAVRAQRAQEDAEHVVLALAVMCLERDDVACGIVEQRVNAHRLGGLPDAQRRTVTAVALPQRAGMLGLAPQPRVAIGPHAASQLSLAIEPLYSRRRAVHCVAAMGWLLDEDEARRVRALDSEARYALAINTIREHGELWTLEGADGWVVNAFREGASSIGIWPHERLAEMEAVGEAADTRAVRITLERWLSERRAAWFQENNLRVSVFLVGPSSITAEYVTVADEIRGEPRQRYLFEHRGSGVARQPKRETRTTRDLVQYLTRREVDVVLSRVPAEFKTHIGDVLLRRSSDATSLGSARPGGTGDITISSMLPVRVSLGRYAYSGQSPAEFGAPRLGQWPPWAVRRFLLYDVLLHEIGHLQIIGPKGSWVNTRNTASETRAREFADELRRTLFSETFDHPDPIHNPPTDAEMSTLAVWERLNKDQRGRLVRLVLAAPNSDTTELSLCGALTGAQQGFLCRLLTSRRG
jgi:hypothetical protein